MGDSKNPLVSVIVPVYNVEGTIQECVESILGQTYRSIEVILVDDGSIDSSPSLCDLLAGTDERVHVIHQENKGLSGARNAGIVASQGTFLTFVDSDDYLSPTAIDRLLAAIIEDAADMAIGGVAYVEPDGTHSNAVLHEEALYNEKAYWDEALSCSGDPRSVLFIISCGKLYRRHIFDNVLFDSEKLHEDEFIIHRLVAQCAHIAFTPFICYFYRQNPASITHNKSTRSYLDAAEALYSRSAYFGSRDWLDLSRWSLAGAAWKLVEASTICPAIHRTERYRHLLHNCRKCANQAKALPASCLKEKAGFFLSLRAPYLLACIRRTNQKRPKQEQGRP